MEPREPIAWSRGPGADRETVLKALYFALHPPEVGPHFLHLMGHFLGTGIGRPSDVMPSRRRPRIYVLDRRPAGERLDPADPGRYRLLGNDDEHPGLTRRAEVGAAAEFNAELGHLDHSHLAAVLVPKERERAPGEGHVERHHARQNFPVGPDLLVHPSFDGPDFAWA